MENLIKQVSEAKKESRQLRDENSVLRAKNDELVQQTESLKLKNTEMIGELKLATKKEQDLRDQNLKLEMHFNESTTKLEADVKASKRNAAQQVRLCYRQEFYEVQYVKVFNCVTVFLLLLNPFHRLLTWPLRPRILKMKSRPCESSARSLKMLKRQRWP